jgi:hypothetical protein
MSSLLEALHSDNLVSLQEVKDLINIGSTYRIQYTDKQNYNRETEVTGKVMKVNKDMMNRKNLYVRPNTGGAEKIITGPWITEIEEVEERGPPILKGGRRRRKSCKKHKRKSCKKRRRSYRKH